MLTKCKLADPKKPTTLQKGMLNIQAFKNDVAPPLAEDDAETKTSVFWFKLSDRKK